MNKSKSVLSPIQVKNLLSLPTKQAEQLFQSFPKDTQLDIIRSTRNPKLREELYYLVPDCTELIQDSPTEDVLQVLDTLLGTGLACGLLPCLSNQQFEELIDIAIWKDGKLNEHSLSLWLFELSECEREDLRRFLGQIDMRLLAGILKNRVKLKGNLAALMIDEKILDPSHKSIECKDDQAKRILNAIWEADNEIFYQLLREMFGIDKEGDVESKLTTAIEEATAEREERVRQRDSKVGINVTESDLKEEVDLDSLELSEEVEENADQ
ncbi:hypothetical protein JT359_18320 [Candidatus Poribacteria bacterium]|nr:hypothetical protein [Candidatus Poribacteria bacterium]